MNAKDLIGDEQAAYEYGLRMRAKCTGADVHEMANLAMRLIAVAAYDQDIDKTQSIIDQMESGIVRSNVSADRRRYLTDADGHVVYTRYSY